MEQGTLEILLRLTASVILTYFSLLKELLQSEKVIQVLKAHQKKVKENKIKEIEERKLKKEQEPPKENTDQGNPPCLPSPTLTIISFAALAGPIGHLHDSII